jgi:hypothetical protein
MASIGAIVAGFFAVHLPWLRAGVWRDEAVSVYVGSAPTWAEYFHRYRRMDYSPPLFDGIVGLWGRGFGFGEGSLAALAALLAAAALLACALAAWKIGGGAAAIFSVLLLGSNDILFWELDQVRPYAFSVTCACLVLALFVGRWRDGEKRARFTAHPSPALGHPSPIGEGTGVGCARSAPSDVAFGVALTLLGLSHYAGTLAVAALGVLALTGWRIARRRSFWKSTALLCAIPGVLLLPWLAAVREQIATGLPWNPSSTWVGRLQDSGEISLLLLPRFGPASWSRALLPVLLILGAMAAGRWVVPELERVGAGMLTAAVLGLPVLVLFGLAFGVARYASIAVAASAVVLGCLVAVILCGLRRAGKGWLAAAGASIIVAGIVGSEGYRFVASDVSHRAPSRSGVKAMLAGLRPGQTDLFVTAPSYLAPTLWFYGVRGESLHGFPQWENPQEIDYAKFGEIESNPKAANECVSRIATAVAAGKIRRIILVSDLNPTPAVRRSISEIARALSESYRPMASGVFHAYPETIEAAVFQVRRP